MKSLRTKFLYTLVCASLLVSLFITQPVHAASFSVTTPAELIAAINSANTNNANDVITLSANITLTAIDNGQNGLPIILTDGGHSLTIEGGGFILSRNGAAPDFRILQIGPGASVTINDLAITGGSNAPGAGINMQTGSNLILDHVEVSGNNSSGRAGGVYNYYATLTIQNGSMIGKSGAPNTGCGGGGVFAEGTSITTLDASTVSYNTSANCAGGGFFLLYNAQLIVQNGSVISNNVGGDPGDYPPFTDPAGGGGIYGTANPTITISDSVVSNNTVNCAGNPNCGGGGLQGASSVTITNSTFSNNTVNCNTSTPCGGGGIYNYATLTIANSTFSGNSTASDGGGIYNHATLTITNSTFSGNSAAYGGGINNQSSLTFTNSTLSGNTATGSGGGIYNNNVVNYSNTIIANSSSGGDCYNVGTIGIHLNSLVEDGSCSASLSGDPNLGPLANNGGPTQTHALLAGSPAINTGTNTGCPSTDQRGVPRPIGSFCDIGAYEYFALGNLVWNDLDNDGLLNGAEAGYDGVTVELWSGDGNTLLDTTTTSGGGIYTFNILSAGDYIVRLPASNFNPAGILRDYHSSTGQIPTLAYEPAPDPDTNTADSDDNGTETNGLIGFGGYIQTLPITLTSSSTSAVDFGVNKSPQIDLVVTKTDSQSTYKAGDTLNYVIVVTNNGPADANGMTVSDARPAQITSWTWTCASGTPAAYNCTDDATNPATFTDSLDLPQLASVIYNVTAQVAPTATGDLSNMVVVIPPADMTDMTPRDNFAIDMDTYSTTLRSMGSQDGWILESSETSGVGGSLNANSNLLYVGDDAQDKQYRSFLSFNTAGLPDNAIITSLKLKVKVQGFVGGNMFTPVKTHGNLIVDISVPYFKQYFGYTGNLYLKDFQSTEGANSVGVLKLVSSTGWYTITLKPAAYSKLDLKEITQFRLRFQKDDNDDHGADYIKIFSGNAPAASRPQLIVEYSVP